VLLKVCGIDILDVANWPPRKSDRFFQQQVLEAMQRTGADERQIAIINSELGCPRFRPEEVVGGCMHAYTAYPLSQSACDTAATLAQRVAGIVPPPVDV
jgi:hypothetical protein